ncbi:translation initiation factor IF-2-like [Panthera leo]|uniref:translation initiation factor IF-2-like n=1 Tax=Panthera leo TaxID=9689 RepID=UPI001C698871|nr:translation initiation factor IF-2-like [Panthera leo]
MAPSALSPRLPRPRRGCARGKGKSYESVAWERQAQNSPNGGPRAGRRRRRRVPGARVRGPAAARGGSGSLGGGPGGQCRQPVRGDGCSSSPRPPGRAKRRWRRAAEVAANCAPGRDARGMSPRRACTHRRGPSRSLPQPPRGEGFLLAARSPALPAPASMPSAPAAAPAGSASPGFPAGPAEAELWVGLAI